MGVDNAAQCRKCIVQFQMSFCITARFQAAFYHIAIHIYYYKIVRSQFVIIHTRWLNND